MELQDFVTQSILQITKGVEAAQECLADSTASANPPIGTVFTQSQTGGTNMALGWGDNGDLIHMLQFDVAVTATDGKKTKGGIGVVTGIVALGSQGQSEQANAHTSRIKFGVPIQYPKKT